VNQSKSDSDGDEMLPLYQTANMLGVPSKWLREQAELGKVPGLQAGTRWLFVPSAAKAAVRAMARRAVENERSSK
jgi:hypothetical protein